MSQESTDQLGEQIRSFYLEATLSDKQVETILERARRGRSATLRRRWIQLTAAFVTMALSALLLYPSWKRRILSERVAAEVLFNFQKSQVDNIHVTHEYGDLAHALPRLDFEIEDLTNQVTAELDLMGGRYCRLQGIPAAQLRFTRRSDGRSGTLYVVRRTEQLNKVGKNNVKIGDFEIAMWYDETRFFALTFELPHAADHMMPFAVGSLR